MQTQIRLKEQSDQDLQCLSFHLLHLSDTLLHCKTELLMLMTITVIILGVPFFYFSLFQVRALMACANSEDFDHIQARLHI